MAKIFSRDEFFKQIKSGLKLDEDVQVRKEYVVEAAANQDDRTVKFIISTGDIDRDNDKIDQKGWDLADYKRAPVVLWAHDHECPPIARAIEIALTSKGLVSVAKFPDPGIYPFADMIFNLVKGGFINAASVGFKPDKYALDQERGGVNFAKQALLEWSIVPVPANQNALVAASAAGIELAPLRKWMAALLADWPGELVLPGKAWQKILGAAAKHAGMVDPRASTRKEDQTSGKLDALALQVSDLAKSVELLAEAKTTVTVATEKAAEDDTSTCEPTDGKCPESYEMGKDGMCHLVEKAQKAAVAEDDLDLPDFEAFDIVPTMDLDVTPEEIRAMLSDSIGEVVRALAADATRKKINELRGRLD